MYRNLKYISISTGQYFGVLDIVSTCIKYKNDSYDDLMQYKGLMRREFTIKSQTNCELLTLNVRIIDKMKQEFLESYEMLFDMALRRLRYSIKLKLHALKYAQKFVPKFRDPNMDDSKKSSMFSFFSKKSALVSSKSGKTKQLDLTDVKPEGFIPFYLFEIDQDSGLLDSELD